MNPEPSRYYFDTEFIEDGHIIDLISIGIVCEDGREFYAESVEVDWSKASQWVLDNVKPHLVGSAVSREQIAADVLAFVEGTRPVFWAYYADYDWVALCQLFGTMMDLPDGWPMFCMDLKQLCVECGDPQLPEQESHEHHALTDARWNRDVHASLTAGWLPPEEAEALRHELDRLASDVALVVAEARVRELEASWIPPERVEEIDCPRTGAYKWLPHHKNCVCRGSGKLRIVREETT